MHLKNKSYNLTNLVFLGLWVIPNAYTLRHARGYGRSALRNWQFQVSKDGVTWTTLYDHQDDQSLNDPGSTGTWQLSPSKDEKQGWRHIRLQQGGKNASGQTHYLSLSGFELYGTVTGVCDELGNYSPFFCYGIMYIRVIKYQKSLDAEKILEKSEFCNLWMAL